MHRVGTWLQRGRLHASESTQSLNSLAESQNLEVALRAAELILNDDIEGAEKSLENGNSSFHKLARGVIYFLQAVLSFEQDVMHEASAQLSDAETTAANDQYRSQHDSGAFNSDIYDKGSEFALCHAQSQIMSAVVGVLNESLIESIRGFYKLRKAYGTLDGLMEMENKFMIARGVNSFASSKRPSQESLKSVEGKRPKSPLPENSPPISKRTAGASRGATKPSALRLANNFEDKIGHESDDSDHFYDADEDHDKTDITKTYTGKIEISPDTSSVTPKFANMSLKDQEIFRQEVPSPTSLPSIATVSRSKALNLLNHDPDSDIFANPLDVFIHSGANFAFGLLSLLISVIPPAFGKLLYIIGFRGDRERGMRMLWQAAKFGNINGGMAGLIILGWYNGMIGFCDIISDPDPNISDEVEGYPMARLQDLLARLRKRYPQSQFWLIEEARIAAAHRRLDEALDKLDGPGKSQMKQLVALHMFEKSLDAMFAHRYQLCADSFIACIDLNSWSRALYYYIAGAAHISLYRELKGQPGKEKEAKQQAKLAEENFKVAPTHIGKKKIMGKQLPFETFVNRKVAKWEQRALERDCELVDAVGVSPLEEMIYLWNGYKKMDQTQLELSLKNFAWSEAQEYWEKEEMDEKAILALLKATVLRNLRRHDEAKALLKQDIIRHETSLFKGNNKDDWTAPTAHYEMAVNIWMERKQFKKLYGEGLVDPEYAAEQVTHADLSHDAPLVSECKEWIEKASKWEKYELDARIGMKVTAATDAIKKWEAKHPNLAVHK